MTPEEIADLRECHCADNHKLPACLWCIQPWPCTVARLLDELDDRAAENERLRRFAEGCIRYGGSAGDDHLCDMAREALGNP